MTFYLEDKDIEQLMAEADEIIQQINADFIKEMEEEDRLRIEIYAQNLKKRKSEIESRIRKEGKSETGSGAQGMHEAIEDIVKAMNGLKKYFTDSGQPPLGKKPAS
jgi:acyl-CoA thioesterase FadM